MNPKNTKQFKRIAPELAPAPQRQTATNADFLGMPAEVLHAHVIRQQQTEWATRFGRWADRVVFPDVVPTRNSINTLRTDVS